jgi:hypothetical protein
MKQFKLNIFYAPCYDYLVHSPPHDVISAHPSHPLAPQNASPFCIHAWFPLSLILWFLSQLFVVLSFIQTLFITPLRTTFPLPAEDWSYLPYPTPR